MFYDEDGDLAHEFYEETIVTKNGQKRAKLRRVHKNLIPQVRGWAVVTQPVLNVWRQTQMGSAVVVGALGGGLGGQAWATSPHVEELRLRPLKTNSEHKQGMAGIWKDHGSLKFRGC